MLWPEEEELLRKAMGDMMVQFGFESLLILGKRDSVAQIRTLARTEPEYVQIQTLADKLEIEVAKRIRDGIENIPSRN